MALEVPEHSNEHLAPPRAKSAQSMNKKRNRHSVDISRFRNEASSLSPKSLTRRSSSVTGSDSSELSSGSPALFSTDTCFVGESILQLSRSTPVSDITPRKKSFMKVPVGVTKKGEHVTIELSQQSLILHYGTEGDGHYDVYPLISVLQAKACGDNDQDFCIEFAVLSKKERAKHQGKAVIDRTFHVGNPEMAKQWVDYIMRAAYGESPRTNRIIVFVNPMSGKKKAPKVLKQFVRPILDRIPFVTYEVKETEYAGHVQEWARSADFSHIDTVMTLSGDGLVYEFVNGMMNRPDADEVASRVVLAPVRAGTGNGTNNTTGLFDRVSATISGAKRICSKLDIFECIYDGDTKNKVYSVLNVAWGVAGDANVNTYHLRWMGDKRFHVGVAESMMALRTYKGKVSIVAEEYSHETCTGAGCVHCSVTQSPAANYFDQKGQWREEYKNRITVMDDKYFLLLLSNTPKLGKNFHMAPYAHLADGMGDLIIVRNPTRKDILNFFLTAGQGTYVETSKVAEYYKVRAMRIEPSDDQPSKGYLEIDGEDKPGAPVSVTVLPAQLMITTQLQTANYNAVYWQKIPSSGTLSELN
eukprot:Clim_evm26s77 gene=Clim_evmTU26s77